MVQRYKLVSIAITATLIGIWIGKTIDTKSNKTDINPTITSVYGNTTSQPHALIQLQHQVTQLKADNHLLREQLQAITAPSSFVAADDINTKNEDAIAIEAASRLQKLEMEQQQRKAANLVNWITQSQKSNRTFDLNNKLLRRFEHQNRDPAWAEQQENHYRQLFASNNELRGIALRNTECRSDQCEVTVGIENLEQSNQLLQTMNKTLANSENPVAIMVATDERTGISKFYISNNEDSFEFN